MHGLLLVANKGDQTLSIIDPLAAKEVAVVAVNGVTCHEVAVSPDGKTAYVPIYGDSGVGKPGSSGSNVVVIDIAAAKVSGNIDFGHGVRPHCAQFRNGLLYVSAELDDSIAIVDPRTLKATGSIPTGQPESHMFVISPDGKRCYTSNVGPGTISVLDLEARTTLKIIPISPIAQRISMTATMVFTSDQTRPRLAVIDTATDALSHWVDLPGLGYGTAPSPDGKWLAVAMPWVNQVAIVDLQTLSVAHAIAVPATPQAVVFQPDGKRAYVSCDASGKIAAIRTSDWTIEWLINAGKLADGLGWAAS
jgi:DNA-binding beta-propeller fold protein YncE